MSTVSKLSIAGAFGALVALTPSGGGALAGPMGVGASAVTPLATPIETVKWVRYYVRRWAPTYRVGHWHPGYWHMHKVATAPVVVATDMGTGCEWVWSGFNWEWTCPRATTAGLFGGGGFLGVF